MKKNKKKERIWALKSQRNIRFTEKGKTDFIEAMNWTEEEFSKHTIELSERDEE